MIRAAMVAALAAGLLAASGVRETWAQQQEAAAPAAPTEQAEAPIPEAPQAAEPAPPAEPEPAAPPSAAAEAPMAPAEAPGLSPALVQLGTQLAASLPKRDVWTVAVADFLTLDGKVTDLGRYTAQRLSTWFSQQPGFRSVERLRLLQAVEELRVESATLANPVIARRVGNQIGFNALVMGTLSGLGQSIELDARMTDLDSGTVLPAVVVRMPKDEAAAALAGPLPVPAAEQASAEPAPREPPGVMMLDESSPPPLAQNESYRVTVESARKDGPNLSLVLAFEGVGSAAFPLLFRKNAYVIDDRGDRWTQTGPDSALIWVFCCDTGLELIPGTKRRTRIDFRTEEVAEGTTFTLVGKEVSPRKERTLVVGGIRLKEPGR